MSARDVVEAVERVVASRRVYQGDDVVVVDGPGGQWKIKQYRNSRGYYCLNVVAPRCTQPMYSVDAVHRALRAMQGGGCDDDDVVATYLREENDDLMDALRGVHTEDALDPPALDVRTDALATRACHRIQTGFRSYVLRVAMRRHRRVEETVRRAVEAAEKAAAEVRRAMDVVVVSSHSELCHAMRHPGLAPLLVRMPSVTTVLHSVPIVVTNLLTIMTDPTGLTRDVVATHGAQLTAEHGARTVVHRAAKAIRLVPHYPLLVGALPLPNVDAFEFRGRYVRCARAVSAPHAALLNRTFGERWVKHVRHLVHLRDMRSFDVFTDRALTDYRCSIVVSKHLVRVLGRVYPAVHIVSMASSSRRCGNGTLMMDLCKVILFSDAVDIGKGIVFAQCLKIDFWEYRLHEDPRAQALVVQMQMVYPEMPIESSCTMKMTEYEQVDEGAPSPAKVLA